MDCAASNASASPANPFRVRTTSDNCPFFRDPPVNEDTIQRARDQTKMPKQEANCIVKRYKDLAQSDPDKRHDVERTCSVILEPLDVFEMTCDARAEYSECVPGANHKLRRPGVMSVEARLYRKRLDELLDSVNELIGKARLEFVDSLGKVNPQTIKRLAALDGGLTTMLAGRPPKPNSKEVSKVSKEVANRREYESKKKATQKKQKQFLAGLFTKKGAIDNRYKNYFTMGRPVMFTKHGEKIRDVDRRKANLNAKRIVDKVDTLMREGRENKSPMELKVPFVGAYARNDQRVDNTIRLTKKGLNRLHKTGGVTPHANLPLRVTLKNGKWKTTPGGDRIDRDRMRLWGVVETKINGKQYFQWSEKTMAVLTGMNAPPRANSAASQFSPSAKWQWAATTLKSDNNNNNNKNNKNNNNKNNNNNNNNENLVKQLEAELTQKNNNDKNNKVFEHFARGEMDAKIDSLLCDYFVRFYDRRSEQIAVPIGMAHDKMFLTRKNGTLRPVVDGLEYRIHAAFFSNRQKKEQTLKFRHDPSGSTSPHYILKQTSEVKVSPGSKSLPFLSYVYDKKSYNYDAIVAVIRHELRSSPNSTESAQKNWYMRSQGTTQNPPINVFAKIKASVNAPAKAPAKAPAEAKAKAPAKAPAATRSRSANWQALTVSAMMNELEPMTGAVRASRNAFVKRQMANARPARTPSK